MNRGVFVMQKNKHLLKLFKRLAGLMDRKEDLNGFKEDENVC